MITRRQLLATSAGAFALTHRPPRAQAQSSPIRIGLLLPFTGQFAFPAAQLDDGVKLYMKHHGEAVAGRQIEIVRRDTTGAPEVAKRLAGELVADDRVDVLAGFVITPEAFAVADVSATSGKLMVVMNAAASAITNKSPYIVRSSYTIAQVCAPLGRWAFENGVRRVYSIVADYAPGHDAEASFQSAFAAAGGKTVGGVRTPLASVDFSSYVQGAADAAPDAIFVSVPGGTQPARLARALREKGIDATKIRILGTGELTYDEPLKSLGDAALGVVTAFHYDYGHPSRLNTQFVKDYNSEFGRNPDNVSIGGYDGMHVIFEALRSNGGATLGSGLIAAAKGLSWESPRGPTLIDSRTRDIVNPVYIRRVERVAGRLQNVEIAKFENVKDPVKEAAN